MLPLGLDALDQQAAALWKTLDELAQQDPLQYRAFIQQQLQLQQQVQQIEQQPAIQQRRGDSAGASAPPQAAVTDAEAAEAALVTPELAAFTPTPGFVFRLRIHLLQQQQQHELIRVITEPQDKNSSLNGSKGSADVWRQLDYFINVCCSTNIKPPEQRTSSKLPATAAEWQTAKITVSIGTAAAAESQSQRQEVSVHLPSRKEAEQLRQQQEEQHHQTPLSFDPLQALRQQQQHLEGKPAAAAKGASLIEGCFAVSGEAFELALPCAFDATHAVAKYRQKKRQLSLFFPLNGQKQEVTH
ncbi:hypothetical protein cyc_06283 [Cyclospora cayetanensis]|uniref:PIH1 N-terminal domain-containing protein n=1 Tax=Cyclospora cayetanensis TaxID=88456 RepID=A0A1D3CRG1_9EIME|nr:hypothetical protein cyc_06283 [Cyclospora cayetanensis]